MRVEQNRSLALLELLSLHGAQSAKDIALALAMPISTTYRLLNSLSESNLVSANDGHFELGIRMLAMVWKVDVGASLGRMSLPVLWSLVERFRETALLTMVDGYDALCMESAEPRRAIRLRFGPGERYPLHLGASAKPLLAFAKPDKQNAYYRHLVSQPNGAEAVMKLKADISEIQRTEIAVSHGELDEGVVGVGAAIFWNNDVVACLSIAGPTDRLTEAKIELARASVRRAAEGLSLKLSI